jgi:hypothetical protein
MKKLAANYLVSETGKFLKNGILVAEEDGTAVEFIDTEGNLDEIALLSFHNGILISGFSFHRINAESTGSKSIHFLSTTISQFVAELPQISIHELIEIGKQVQMQFPEMKIPEILSELNSFFTESGHFRKERIPGIFLLIGANLLELHFTAKSRLKKIL